MRRALRPVALLAMMVGTGGCFAWRTVGALPRTANLPADTRITKFDGTVIVLTQSRIENDTIRGFLVGNNYRYVIPLAHVDLIEAKQFQPRESLITGVLVGGLIYAVIRGMQVANPFGPIEATP